MTRVLLAQASSSEQFTEGNSFCSCGVGRKAHSCPNQPMPALVEATLKGTTRHEMPEWLLAAYERGIKNRLFKTVRTFLAMLPEEYRKLVRSDEFKPYPEPVKGHKVSWVLYDELATPEEVQRALEWMARK